MLHRPSRPVAAVLAALAAACTGPTLRVDNPDRHVVFLDGVQTRGGVKPFRYYGVTRWDALPADRGRGERARADWTRAPTSEEVAIPPPASPWLFPFDLGIELVARVLHGRDDRTTTVRARAVASPPPELAAADGEALAARGREARIRR